MRQLFYLGPGRVEWREVADPQLCDDTDALVRPLAVATCDLDTALLRGDVPFEGPFPLGHEGVAEVVAVGDDVRRVLPGDRVIVPFQISCGRCDRCRKDLTASCTTAGPGAMYGLEPYGGPWGGFLADIVRVPWADHMLVAMPASLDPVAVASMSDNIPDAWRTVGPFIPHAPGTPVLVIGGGGPSVSFYSIAIALALGAASVTYVDHDEARLAKAEGLGASIVPGLDALPSRNYPVTVCSARSQLALTSALRATEPDGTCVCNAIFFEGAVALPMLDMYVRGVRLVTGRVNARAVIPLALDLVTRGTFDPTSITDLVVEWDNAPAALTDRPQKLVMRR